MSIATEEGLTEALRRMGLAGPHEQPSFTPLTGGVSSDIHRVDAARGAFCVKRALARLKVDAEWTAPVERNRYEVAWMRVARGIAPDFVPAVLGQDEASGAFAMEWLDPEQHPVWKAELRDGVIDPHTAAEVGRGIASIHAATFDDERIAAMFPTDAIFHAIRLEPYLLATARAHPDRARALEALVETTATNRCALVHGDVSPKNILVGPRGPILLDAECAWYGDPAFDLAFCLNHMLLKCIWRPQWREEYLGCFDALARGYVHRMELRGPAIARRAAQLLPGLLLGRVDGKSPVEYITRDDDRERVRRVARALLARPPAELAEVRDAWRSELAP